MSVRVTHEPPDAYPGAWVLERCCVCRKQTRYWFTPKDIALCLDCAETATPESLPTKDEWFDSERALTEAGR